jgi:hypothetical protein
MEPTTRVNDGHHGIDETAAHIGQAIALGQQGRRAEARHAFAQIWAAIGNAGDPLHRCMLAHHMADVQDDMREELAWDFACLGGRGLDHWRARSRRGSHGSGARVLASLHLNLGEDYRKLGNVDRARRHLDLGRQSLAFLGSDPYSLMIKGGLDGLAGRLSS